MRLAGPEASGALLLAVAGAQLCDRHVEPLSPLLLTLTLVHLGGGVECEDIECVRVRVWIVRVLSVCVCVCVCVCACVCACVRA